MATTTIAELARLRRAKAEIKEEIEAKGVSVPSSALLDEYDGYVRQIQVEGGPAVWGGITGDIDDQTDLKEILDGKADIVDDAVEDNFASFDSNGNLKDSGYGASDFLTDHQDITGKADKDEDAVEGNFAAFDSSGNPVDSGHKHGDYLTSHQDISTKADKVSNPTSGNFAGLDSNGNLTDSGSKASDFATAAQGELAVTAYQKPSSGIPAADLASGVIPTVHNVPSGGSSGQVLAKASATDYDTEWVTPSSGGSSITVDNAMSDSSENPVQNKVIHSALANKQDKIDANNKLSYDLISGAPSVDSAPTQNSNNLVESGGVYTALANLAASLGVGFYIGTSTNWGTSAGNCYLRTSYFANSEVPQRKGDLVYSTGTKNLHQCGTLTWDEGQNCYKTTPTFIFTIPTVPTISTDISSDASSDAKTASPKAVKTYVDGAVEANPTVPSGTTPTALSNLKVGNGYYSVGGGSPVTISTDIASDKADNTKAGGAKAIYDLVKPASQSSIPQGGLLPGIKYHLGTLTGSVTMTLASPADASVENEYKGDFTADSTPPTITWSGVTEWAGNCLDSGTGLPVLTGGKHYEFNIENGYGIIVEYGV